MTRSFIGPQPRVQNVCAVGTQPRAPEISCHPAQTSGGPSGPGQGRAGRRLCGRSLALPGRLWEAGERGREQSLGRGELARGCTSSTFSPSAQPLWPEGQGGACFVVASARRSLQAGAEVLGGRVSRPGNPSKAQPANPPVEGGVRQSSAFLVQSEPGTWATRLKEGTGTLRSWTILQTGTVTVPTSRAPAVRRMQRLVLQRGPHGTFVAPRGGGARPPISGCHS